MDAVNVDSNALPPGVGLVAVEVPYLGSVNLWLLKGDPLTLVDTGPANAESLASLERQLHGCGLGLDDLELVLLTHHHLDHSGLTGAIVERSGAAVAASAGVAGWGLDYHARAAEERRFGSALQRAHGVPGELVEAGEPFWTHIVRNSADFCVTRVLASGDLVDAGGRSLRVVERPGHSVTDTLFVDERDRLALVGDHLLAEITSGAEVVPSGEPDGGRRRALPEYLAGLRETVEMPLDVLLPGHGPVVRDHRSLIARRLAFHEDRLRQVAALLGAGGSTAFGVARRLWGEETAATQTVLAVWEVLGHLDVLVERGLVEEEIVGGELHVFRATVTVTARP